MYVCHLDDSDILHFVCRARFGLGCSHKMFFFKETLIINNTKTWCLPSHIAQMAEYFHKKVLLQEAISLLRIISMFYE